MKVLALEFGVFSHVGADHFFDLPILKQQAQTEIIHACVVGITGQSLHALFHESRDEMFGNAAKAEATDGQACVIKNIHHSFISRSHALVNHLSLQLLLML